MAIDNHHFAVVAVVILFAQEGDVYGGERLHLHPAVGEGMVVPALFVVYDVVVHQAYLNPLGSFGGQGIADVLSDVVGLELEKQEMDVVLGGVDVVHQGIQHGVEGGVDRGAVAFGAMGRKFVVESFLALRVD